MASLRELKKKYRDPRNQELHMSWVGRHVYSNLAIPITKLLLPTGITPNQVTIIGLVGGISGCASMSLGNYWSTIVGIVLFQIAYTLDYVDGTLARIRGESSLTGYYMDKITGDLLSTILFPSLGIGCFLRTQQSAFLLLGSAAGLGLLFTRHIFNVKILAVLETQKERAFAGLRSFTARRQITEPRRDKKKGLCGFLRFLLIKGEFSWKIPYVINFVLITAILDLLNILVVFYGLFLPMIATYIFLRQLRSDFEWVYEQLNRGSKT